MPIEWPFTGGFAVASFARIYADRTYAERMAIIAKHANRNFETLNKAAK